MISIALLAARLLVPDPDPTLAYPADQRPDASGPVIVVHRQPEVPIVALRMSILAEDPAGYAGAGHMIQHVLYPALRDRAGRVGGTAQIQRTSDAIVYTVTGPAHEIQYLADLLIGTLELPSAPLDVILRSERELREERLAEWETADTHTRSLLRAQLFPADISAAGTDRAATRFSGQTLPAIWADMYQPDRVSIVAVGDVYLGDVQTAFSGVPDGYQTPRLGIEQDSVVLFPLAPPQATRAWIGTGYLASDLPPAAVTVAVRLLGDEIRRRLPNAEVAAEHWWTHHGQAAVIVAAVPGTEIQAAHRVIATAMETLRADLTYTDVQRSADAIRREMLFYARTPDRMAELIGQFIDREGDPNATERFYSELSRVDDADVREVLEILSGRTPASVEIPPQPLRTRR